MLRKQPSLHLYVADDINLVSDSGRLLLWPRTHDTFAPTISSLLPVLGRETIYCLTTMTQAMDSSNDNWKYFCLWVYWSRHFVTVGYFRTRFENSIGIEKEKMNSVGDVNGSICYAGMEACGKRKPIPAELCLETPLTTFVSSRRRWWAERRHLQSRRLQVDCRVTWWLVADAAAADAADDDDDERTNRLMMRPRRVQCRTPHHHYQRRHNHCFAAFYSDVFSLFFYFVCYSLVC